MSVLLVACPLHAGWIDAEPRLAPSQLDFRIRLAEQRLHAYPADNLDFVMIDLERPEDSVRHAWQCAGDMTGRTIEFLAETRRIMPDLAREPVDALYARMRRAPRQPAWLARRYFPYWKLTRDPELLDWIRKTYAHMAETADKPDRKNGHGVFCCSQVEGLADLWEVTRDPKLIELAKADAKRSLAVRYRHSHHHMNAARAALKMARVTGERSFAELVRPLRDELLACQYADGSVAEVLPTSERTEGCSISDWVSLNLRWWDVTGDESALDVAEHALVNGLWLNQFTSGAFGHREYKRNGYGTEIQEAWWCCTQNAGLIMCEVARHAVQMSDDGRTFRVNFPFPGRYGFVRGGKRVEVEVKSDYPAAYAAEAKVVGAPDAAVVFRVPKYVRNAVAAKTGEGAWRLTGDVGHYLEQRGGGWTVNYGPLMLSPMVYSWENFSSAGDVPAGYIPPTVDGSSLLLPAKLETDANGFVKFPGGRACLPEWPVFDDGTVSRTGTGFRAPALVTLKDGTGKDKQLYFHPLCAQTSCGVLRYMPMVFAREENVYSAKSPDGRNEIRLSTDGAFAYTVLRDGVALVKSSPLALVTAAHGTLGAAGARVVSAETTSVRGTAESPVYKKASVSLEGQVCTVSFEGGWKIALHARNDAVAYRFETAFGGREKVVSETADLALPNADTAVYAAYEWGWWAQLDRFQNSWENVYQKLRIADVGPENEHLVYLPLVVRHGGKTMCVTESNLLDYPGWNLVRKPTDADRLTGVFAACPDQAKIRPEGVHRRVMGRLPYLAETDGTRAYPWRVFLLCDEPSALCEADAVWALAEPSRIGGDLGWIRPGKAAWDWWNNWNVTGVDFRAGVNTATYEHFIDFAAENGLEYVILDDGWSKRDDMMQTNPDVDLPRLLKRAAEKDVGLILWGGWAQIHGRQREVFGKYAKMGVKGFKIDFMDRDDQAVERFLEETARIAAEYRLVLDYHGMHKPTGLSRTYPNVLNYEGVHGLEQVKWNSADPKATTGYNAHLREMKDYFPWNDLMCFYCRMSAGPMDYTPGAMRNLKADGWRAYKFRPSSQSTRVHQMALMSLYEAPLQMMCDSPTAYRRNRECLDYMAAVPTVWDETRALAGDMDSFAGVARRRGDTWWVSAIGGRAAQTAKVKLDFLGEGRWRGDVFADGVNADRDAEDYVRRTLTVRSGDEIEIRLAPGGGGWTGCFRPER